MLLSKKFGQKFSPAVIFRTTAYSAGLPPVFDSDRFLCDVATGGLIGAISESGDTQVASAIVENGRLIAKSEWQVGWRQMGLRQMRLGNFKFGGAKCGFKLSGNFKFGGNLKFC